MKLLLVSCESQCCLIGFSLCAGTTVLQQVQYASLPSSPQANPIRQHEQRHRIRSLREHIRFRAWPSNGGLSTSAPLVFGEQQCPHPHDNYGTGTSAARAA
jgi:hypothetical protein